MKLKLDENGNAVLKDGKPVYVQDNGDEIAVDVPMAFAKITELQKESKGYREEAKTSKERLAAFENLDPAEAVKAINIVKNLDQKKLIDAGEVDKVKGEVVSAYEQKLSKKDEELAGKDGIIYKLMVSNQLSSSAFVSDKLLLPPDLVESAFGKHFKVEDGKVVAYLNDDKIYSKERPGELASVDEALAVIVDAYPGKDKILKGANGNGSGAQQRDQQRDQDGKHKKRSEMSDVEKSKYIADYGLDAFQKLAV